MRSIIISHGVHTRERRRLYNDWKMAYENLGWDSDDLIPLRKVQ